MVRLADILLAVLLDIPLVDSRPGVLMHTLEADQGDQGDQVDIRQEGSPEVGQMDNLRGELGHLRNTRGAVKVVEVAELQ